MIAFFLGILILIGIIAFAIITGSLVQNILHPFVDLVSITNSPMSSDMGQRYINDMKNNPILGPITNYIINSIGAP